MAKILGTPKCEIQITISLTEEEARALHSLTAYGDDVFLKMFYQHIGTNLKDYEQGLRNLFDGVKQSFPVWLRAIGRARNEFTDCLNERSKGISNGTEKS